MKIAAVIIGAIILTVGIAAAAVYYTAAGQDALYSRVIKAVMATPPESFDGMRVVVCGSASPLGNDPDRAQACKARAAEAGITQVAYYHLVPVPANALMEKMFARGLASETILVRDLHTFDLPPDSTEIHISEAN